MNDTSRYADAPRHQKFLDAVNAEDQLNKDRSDASGSCARFRIKHGHLGEHAVSEYIRDAEYSDVAIAYLSNFTNAIVNLVMNGDGTARPEQLALAFLRSLADSVRDELIRLQEGDLKREGIATIGADGKLTDFDATEELKHGDDKAHKG